MKDDLFYFIHMLECIRNRTIRDAVMHNLQLLAESSKRVSEAERVRHPEIPWRDLADFRNVVVHDYLKTDLDEIWLIIHDNLPPLQADLTRIVGEPRPRS